MNCVSCDNSHFKSHIFYERMFGTNEEFEYLECLDCGLIQIKDIPTDMSKYYGVGYYSLNKVDTKTANSKSFKRQVNELKKNVLEDVVEPESYGSAFGSLKIDYNARILDVGCGSGDFLYRLTEVGYKNLHGVDPFLIESIEYENGVRVFKKDFMDLNERYDLVMLNHSFEHMPNPVQALEKLKHLINRDGKILIRIPVKGYSWFVYNDYFFGLDAPRHFFIHSIDSFKILSKKCGLTVESVFFDSVWDYLGQSEKYLLGLTYKDKPYKGFFERLDYLKLRKKLKFINKELNKKSFGDQAAFILKIAN